MFLSFKKERKYLKKVSQKVKQSTKVKNEEKLGDKLKTITENVVEIDSKVQVVH